MNHMVHTLLVGVAATVLMDAWGMLRRPLLGWPRPDYAMPGRWLGHMWRGRFRHAAIGRSAPIPGERIIGWTAHYATGIGFALGLVTMFGIDWLQRPSLGAALLFGVATAALPLLVVQPATGMGLAARHTQRPGQVRVQVLVTHAIFGLGLYLSGRMLSLH